MKTATLFGIAAMGLVTASVGNSFATPALQVTVGSNTATPTVTPLGSGTYYFANSSTALGGGSLGGFSWDSGWMQVNAATNQFTLTLNTVTNGNTGGANKTITFLAEENISDPGALSMQAAGTATGTNATSSQTVDFSSSVASSIPSDLAFQDSGVMGLNSASSPTSPSHSVAYSSPGANLAAFSGELTVINQVILSLNPTASLTTGSLTTNISNTSVTTPEPATLALFAVGGLALLTVGRRNKSRS